MESDGCTLWFQGNWRHCCEIHDAEYFEGFDKLQSDLNLMSCVADAGWPLMGLIMFIGVSIFGWFFYPRNKTK